MPDQKQSDHNEVTLEDLLRVKREERPDDLFWNQFDQELHQRMLQTLVKKDAWYLQVLRGLSGRIAQTTAVGAAAAVLAMMVVRPAFVSVTPNEPNFASNQESVSAPVVVEVAMSDFDGGLVSPDYAIESVSALDGATDVGYTRDFNHDTIEVAAYDTSAYEADSVFAVSGVATTLVY